MTLNDMMAEADNLNGCKLPHSKDVFEDRTLARGFGANRGLFARLSAVFLGTFIPYVDFVAFAQCLSVNGLDTTETSSK